MTVDKRFLVPLLGFMLLVTVLALGFKLRDPHLLPSQMLNRSLPTFSLPRLGDSSKTWSEKDLYGKVSLLNVWATWCPSCVQEHPQLMRISREEDISVFGINYNDDTAKALAWLQRYGNPFQLNIADHDGQLAIDLGVYGAPETFLVDAKGVIRYRHVGVVDERVWADIFAPMIAELNRQAGGS
jgi:cytochrome c biogenesis protein CcmG/thiol:disulfide interchange protein DsbE